MQRINAYELVNELLAEQEAAAPEKDLFLSSFVLKGENQLMKAHIKNVFIRPDFTLNITQMHMKETVEFVTPFPTEIIGFTFCLQGKSLFKIPIDKQELPFEDGTSTCYKTIAHEGIALFESGQDYCSVAIHFEVNKFKEIIGEWLHQLPEAFRTAIDHQQGHQLYVFPFAAKTRLLLQSLLNDDYSGLSRQFFIESKVLEIVGQQLELLIENQTGLEIKDSELEKVMACEALLRERYNQPHSLLQLARKVGLNDFKLKQGFKKVYGKPVFKYLQEYRLQKAKELLENEAKTVSEVAFEIGYSSTGSFSNAFFEYHGVRPNVIKSV
ncbi:helix-turn-helix domain-containing protein [bacterium]|nr:helix-turn-helix domain-containing protein [bacterium]